MPRKYYGACDSHGVGSWTGKERDTYEEAKKDADKHDKDKHGGVETAAVLNVERP